MAATQTQAPSAYDREALRRVPRVSDHYASRLADLRDALEAVQHDEVAEGPDALAVEREEVYRIVLGTGGPHDEVRVRLRAGEVVGGEYVYLWHGMPGHCERELTSDEAEEWADAYYLAGSG